MFIRKSRFSALAFSIALISATLNISTARADDPAPTEAELKEFCRTLINTQDTCRLDKPEGKTAATEKYKALAPTAELRQKLVAANLDVMAKTTDVSTQKSLKERAENALKSAQLKKPLLEKAIADAINAKNNEEVARLTKLQKENGDALNLQANLALKHRTDLEVAEGRLKQVMATQASVQGEIKVAFEKKSEPTPVAKIQPVVVKEEPKVEVVAKEDPRDVAAFADYCRVISEIASQEQEKPVDACSQENLDEAKKSYLEIAKTPEARAKLVSLSIDENEKTKLAFNASSLAADAARALADKQEALRKLKAEQERLVNEKKEVSVELATQIAQMEAAVNAARDAQGLAQKNADAAKATLLAAQEAYDKAEEAALKPATTAVAEVKPVEAAKPVVATTPLVVAPAEPGKTSELTPVVANVAETKTAPVVTKDVVVDSKTTSASAEATALHEALHAKAQEQAKTEVQVASPASDLPAIKVASSKIMDGKPMTTKVQKRIDACMQHQVDGLKAAAKSDGLKAEDARTLALLFDTQSYKDATVEFNVRVLGEFKPENKLNYTLPDEKLVLADDGAKVKADPIAGKLVIDLPVARGGTDVCPLFNVKALLEAFAEKKTDAKVMEAVSAVEKSAGSESAKLGESQDSSRNVASATSEPSLVERGFKFFQDMIQSGRGGKINADGSLEISPAAKAAL